MPIQAKNNETSTETPVSVPEVKLCCKHGSGHHEGDFGKKIFMTLLGVLIVYLTFYVGTLMRNNIKKYETIGQADTMERTVSIVGTSKISANNDIAMTTVGFTNVDADVSKAQEASKKVMDQVFADLKQMGIADKDLKTNYTINPEYDYTQKGSVFKGYRIDSSLTIKIRDLSKISAVLSLPGKYGANQVGGLSFTIDDTENLKTTARLSALADAKNKAAILANQLGVRLGDVISYSDYENSPAPMYASYAKNAVSGMGGQVLDAGPAQVSSGSQDIVMNVSLTYKIVQSSW